MTAGSPGPAQPTAAPHGAGRVTFSDLPLLAEALRAGSRGPKTLHRPPRPRPGLTRPTPRSQRARTDRRPPVTPNRKETQP